MDEKKNIDKVFDETVKSFPDEVREAMEKEGVTNMEELFLYVLSMTDDPMTVLQKGHAQDGDAEFDSIFDSEIDDDWWEDGLPSGLLLQTESKEYHIRVKLNNAPVSIWRELLVPSNMSMELLAKLLVESMGWNDIHLHQFRRNGVIFKSTSEMDEDMMFEGFGNRFLIKDANTVALGHVLQEKGDRMKFEYDFGDSWEHDVWVKGIREYSADEEPCVRLLKGKGACPPEDCGGVWGYADLLRMHCKKRKTAEEKERLEWFGIDKYFDSEFFDSEEMLYYIEEWWDDVLAEIESRNE